MSWALVGSASVVKSFLEQIRRPSRGAIRITLSLMLVIGASVLLLGKPRLRRHRPGLGRPGPRHRLQPQPCLHAATDHKPVTPEQIDRGHGADVEDHQPRAHLYGRRRHGQGAGDRAALRADGFARLLDRHDLEKNETEIDPASRRRSPTGGRSTAYSWATKRSCATLSPPTSSTTTSGGFARRCPGASRSPPPSRGRPGC